MEKLQVNENCIGCGMCVAIDSDHFEIENGLSVATNSDNLDSDALKTAMDSCPVAAIEIKNECSNNCNCDDNCNCGDSNC